MKIDRRQFIVFVIALVLIPGACGESVSVGRGSSVAVSEGSSAEGILASDGAVTQSSVSSVGIIDDLNIDPWVKNTKGDYVEIGVTGTNVAGFSYSDNYYPGMDRDWVSDAVWAQQWIGASSADSLHAYARASNSAGDNAGADLDLKYGSLNGYYNAAYAGPAPWLGIDRGAFVQQTLDSATGNEILAQTWAVDPVGDAAGALTDVKQGSLNGYSVLAAAARYSNGLIAAGVSVDSMSASSPIGSIDQVMNTYDSMKDTSTVGLEKATTVTGYDGKAYAYQATATATEDSHLIGQFIGAATVGTATKTRTPNFGSEYDLSMTATKGSDPTGTLGYFVDPSMINLIQGYRAIQGALHSAQPGDTINMAAGTYYENVVLDTSLTINGAGAGTDPTIDTIVNGDQKGSVFTIESGTVITLEGMTITNGEADNGGGINNAGTLNLNNILITGNTANNYGGGIYNLKGTVTMNSASSVTDNTAYDGAGIDNDHGIVTMNSGSSISGNNAAPTGYGYGGGIDNTGNVTMNSGSSIFGNAANLGGGIYNDYDGTVTMNGGTIFDNSATNGNNGGIYNAGGGIYNAGTVNIYAGSTISSNTANIGGGIYNYIDGTVIMNGGTISGNTANIGGGIYNQMDGTITMNSGSSITGNTATNGNGSGIYSLGTVTMNSGSSISGNNAAQSGAYKGGGIYNDYDGTVTMNGGTIFDNFAIYGGGIYNAGTIKMNAGTIFHNSANFGGGICSLGTVTMNSGSSITSNTAFNGGGIVNTGTVTMNSGSSITDNKGYTYGGGIYNTGTVTMNSGSSINGNIGQDGGGGIYNTGKVNMNGGTVYNNQPNNVFP